MNREEGKVSLPKNLIEAARRASSRKSVEAFVERDGVEYRDSEGRTALHYAAAAGNRPLVRLLLARGADVSARDGLGATPLHLAAENGSPATIAVLLKAGADASVEDFFGRTPHDLSRSQSGLMALSRNRRVDEVRIEFLSVAFSE